MARIMAAVALAWVGGLMWFALAVPARAPVTERTDGIVVLTGGGGRIERGLALLEAGAARRMLVSGVDTEVRRVELAARFPGHTRLFACCIDLGREAIDTRSNAEETARWVAANEVRSLRLVTSSYHLRRARLEVTAELPTGVRLVPDAVPAELRPAALIDEYSKYLWRAAARAVA